MATLMRRAYRRNVTANDLRLVRRFYEAGRAERDFDLGIQRALERVLVSPQFLFRIEQERAGAAPESVYRVGDFELASRLSFFLWSSIPDDELLDAAAAGTLRQPDVLGRQVKRMLGDPRSFLRSRAEKSLTSLGALQPPVEPATTELMAVPQRLQG